MTVLDVGCGSNKQTEVGIDRRAAPGVDIVHDLTRAPWPVPDDAFDGAYTSHLLEHMAGEDFWTVLREVHRVVRSGGRVTVIVPHKDHDDAWADPTHVRFFTKGTFERICDGRVPWRDVASFRLVSVREERSFRFAGVTHADLRVRLPRLYSAWSRIPLAPRVRVVAVLEVVKPGKGAT